MSFWRHFTALFKKNLILYKRNWKGSLWEFLCPVLLFLMLLFTRLGFEKKDINETHLFDTGFVWYDRVNNPGNDFLDYIVFDSKQDWFGVWKGRDYGPDRTIVALAPSGNAYISDIKTILDSDLASFGLTTRVYSSRDEIISIIEDSDYEKDGNPGICFGAAFVESDDTNNRYQINMIFDDITEERSDDSNMPNQRLDPIDEYQRKPNEDAYKMYKLGGYTYLQNIIANSILRIRTANAGAYISMAYAPVKTSKYVEDEFIDAGENMWNFFVLLIFLAPLYRFVSNSVTEKELKVREAMKIMGLTDTPYWLSWFVYYTIVNTALSIVMLIIMLGIYEHTNNFLLFLYFWLYGMTMFSYGILVSAFFSSGKIAAIAATMLFYVTSFIYTAIEDPTTSETTRTLCAFFPSVGVQLAGINMLIYESSGIGLNWENLNDSYRNFKVGTWLWMNVIFFFVTLLLGLYFENVIPSSAGVRKPFYFPFTKSFWFESKAEVQEELDEEVPNSNKVGDSNEKLYNENIKLEIDQENFEEVPEYVRRKADQNELIKIANLKKKFDQGFYAINDLNVEMYEDEIFALLGHNGAGKTTTINVLCGMMAASKGEAKIYGYDIKTQMKQIRKMMGICPQHNILFPKLTCREHLSIFADFKGMDKKLKEENINQLLKDLNLEKKQNVVSANLSGGFKRKLSLGIALVGGSKVVFLDEPSSGMDVTARREMWDMLKKYRAGRVIILTTHYMEEADNLGDRIGIMSQGQMLCWGTSNFLKNKFGEGYNLVMVKTERQDNPQLENFVLTNVPGSVKVSEVSSEATFLLPKCSAKEFPEFFKKLDNQLSNLNVSSYGVSMTTLEEVFLKVEGADVKEDAKAIKSILEKRKSILEDFEYEDYSISKEQISGECAIFWIHYVALFLKRLILAKRNYKEFIFNLIVPNILIVIGFGLATVQFFKDSDQRVLEPSLFPLPQRLIYNTNIQSGAGSPATLIGLLEPSNYFSPTAVTSTIGGTNTETLNTFDDILYDAAQVNPLEPHRYSHYYFHTLDYTNHRYKILSWGNTTSQEAIVASAHFMYQAVLKNSINTGLVYKMVNDPMPIVQIYKDMDRGGNGFFIGFVLGISFALVPTSIMMFLMSERCTQLLHQQIISGMNKVSYWIANYWFDLLKVYAVCLIAIAFFYIYNVDVEFGWLFLLLYPFAIVPYTYVTSFIFENELSSQNFTLYHNFLISGFGPIAFNVLRIISSTRDVGDILFWLPNVFPSYSMTWGIVTIALKDSIASSRQELPPDSLASDASGVHLGWLIFHCFFWPALLVLIEFGLFNCFRRKGKAIVDEEEALDEDVLEEQHRVETTPESELAVKADHLRKVYDNNVAVKDISFALEFGDCFALLGINGAGKTTTFKCLTNDVVPTKGVSYIVGHDVRKDFSQARKQIGYCPQFDAIFELLTVREHLEFYAKIKKIPTKYVNKLIDAQLKSMNLEYYENKKAGTLSGGNKRKLSVAMAMLGNPPVVFLDEPSAGMDPKARRFMWEIIAKISTRGKNSAVILTTHSMEEAEALSTSMGIMVNGQFKCFGSKQHIKNKFGFGYQLEIKFKNLDNERLENIIQEKKILEFLRSKYASCYKMQTIKGEEILLLNREA